jgi:hypothetical protein
MRLVVDASTLVAEVLRTRGRELLQNPDLELAMAADAWEETRHELGKRTALTVQRQLLSPDLAERRLSESTAVVLSRVAFYESHQS